MWLSTQDCLPPHRVTHLEKALSLELEFRESGWDTAKPPLVGYPYEGSIQLLNGSHRWAAAKEAGIYISVKVVPYETVLAAWGNLTRWAELMRMSET